MASTKTTTGLTLPCPRCGELNASPILHLSDGSTFSCQECEGEFTADALRDIIRRWAKVLAWVDAMPKQDDVDAE